MAYPMNPKASFDLSFGNSVCVRQAFAETVKATPLYLKNDLMGMDYPNHSGDPELVEITRQVIRRQIGAEYKHVFITNGATGGVNIALRAYKQQGFEYCRFRNPPYYARYPGMVEAAGMKRADPTYHGPLVLLVDLPSNPTGRIADYTDMIKKFENYPVILDAVYYNKVYCKSLMNPPNHDVLVGSYSKLLGVNGVRLGWIATDDDLLADRITKLVAAEYLGLSTLSADLIKVCLKDFDWEKFETTAQKYLDQNREEFSKLEKFFGNEPVPKNGMFYCAPMDKQCKKLMEKAGIIWTKGPAMGATDDFGRFNIGQDLDLVKEAVKTVLKIDKK